MKLRAGEDRAEALARAERARQRLAGLMRQS